MQVKLAEAKRRLGTLAARQRAAEARRRYADAHFETDVFARFERLKEKIARAEAEADALRELEVGSRAEPEAAPEAAGETPDVETELAALKRKFNR